MDWRFQMPSFRFPLRLGILWLLWGAGSAPGQAIQTPVRASWTEESSTTATLLWDRPAAGRGTVRYGLTTNYTHVARDGGGVWRHLVVLRGLEPGARYFYEASSTDANAPMAAGVPAITIGAGLDALDGGLERGRARRQAYFANCYHQACDGWTPDWDADGLAADTLLVYDLGLRLANSRDWPQWESGSEFAAARHASNDQRAN